MDNISDVQWRLLKYGGNTQFKEFLRLYGLENEPIETRYFTKACQLYRDRLKLMAEQNRVILFTKDLHSSLPILEGKKSIYGEIPDNIFDKAFHRARVIERESAKKSIRDTLGG
jgi:hypothetical protein